MAVRTDDAVTGGHDAFFGQQGVLDAHLAHIVEVEDIVFVGELAALLGLGGTLDVLVGHKVVQHDGDVLFVEHAVETGALKLVDGDGGGDVVAQHDVQLCVDELACLDLGKPGMCGKDLLRQGHSHGGSLLFILIGGSPSPSAPAGRIHLPQSGRPWQSTQSYWFRQRLSLWESCHRR